MARCQDPLYPPEQYSDVIRTLNFCSGTKPPCGVAKPTIQSEISQGNSMSMAECIIARCQITFLCPEQYSDVIRTLNFCSGIKPPCGVAKQTIQSEISQGNSMSFAS
ncbi:hypothetical protein CEXT_65241 [Caerostris extrusa]|uniref:Uncharacterized protein n=1 Tax=Caerostris extrusa TaxID=172846 RepID=A0AAV4UVV6_CAEEX|nr:hypothetical protein CEXT_65241 [Caerostris extrusa]